MTTLDFIQYIGAFLLLSAFIGQLTRYFVLDRSDLNTVFYLIMNAVGAGMLAVVAFLSSDWGFFTLEGVWSVVSVVDLVKKLKARRERELAQS